MNPFNLSSRVKDPHPWACCQLVGMTPALGLKPA